MDPITLSLLASTAIGGISSIMGGSAANDANETNAQIALMNYYAQQSAKRAAVSEADRQRSDQRLGTTDASGNRTYWRPGIGWVTDLSDTQQDIQNLSEDEMMRQLTTGAARNEEVEADAADRRRREGVLADEAEREFRQAKRPDENALRQLFLAQGAETRNRSADRAGDTFARQALRSGNMNAAEVYQGGRAASDQTAARQAGIEASIMANQEADRRYAADRDSAAQVYDYFRKMSTGGVVAPALYQPSGPAQQSTGSQDQALVNLMSRAPQQEYQSANFALPDTLSDLGNVLGSFATAKQNNMLYNEMRDRYGKNVGALS